MLDNKQAVSLEELRKKAVPDSARRVRSEAKLEDINTTEKATSPDVALDMLAELNSTIPQTSSEAEVPARKSISTVPTSAVPVPVAAHIVTSQNGKDIMDLHTKEESSKNAKAMEEKKLENSEFSKMINFDTESRIDIPEQAVPAAVSDSDKLRANQLLESIFNTNSDIYNKNFVLGKLPEIEQSTKVMVFTTFDNANEKSGNNPYMTQNNENETRGIPAPPPGYNQTQGQQQAQFPQPGAQGQQNGQALPPGSIIIIPANSAQALEPHSTNVVFSVASARFPIKVNCPYCHQEVTTMVSKGPGFKAGICSVLLCFICWPLFFLPFCADSCMDAKHTCPNCRNTISVVKA